MCRCRPTTQAIAVCYTTWRCMCVYVLFSGSLMFIISWDRFRDHDQDKGLLQIYCQTMLEFCTHAQGDPFILPFQAEYAWYWIKVRPRLWELDVKLGKRSGVLNFKTRDDSFKADKLQAQVVAIKWACRQAESMQAGCTHAGRMHACRQDARM